MSHKPQLDRAVRRAFTALCWSVGTPLAYKAILALEQERWVDLATITVAISGYRCPRTLSGDLQVAAFFKKYPDFDLGYDLETRAKEAFWECERQCYRSNEFLAPLLHDPLIMGEGVFALLSEIRKDVKDVLGRCPRVIDLEPRFGPGSTYLDVGPLITVPDKMSNTYTLTPGARVFLHAWDQTSWSRHAAAGLQSLTHSHLPGLHDLIGNDECSPGLGQNAVDAQYAPRTEEIVRGNRFTCVPKDAKKHRGICIEPSLNLFYQLGVGRVLSERMRRKWHWAKDSQQQFHRTLARLGSLTGLQATIDLSNASDTVCKVLVQLLLPKDWYSLVNSLRSPFTLIDGRWVRLEKFSSMGNGFTFELETLLFRSIANVLSRGSKNQGDWHGRVVSTFGDDIICPSDTASSVIAALKFFGFQINKDKTFVDGKFRESCGGDFYGGYDVRPHHLKVNPNEPHQYIALANGLRRFGIRHILCGGPDLYRKPWLRILDQLPKQIRDCTGPESLGDLVVCNDESTWNTKVRSSIRYFRVWRPVTFGRTSWSHFRPGVVLASALYGCGDGRPTRTLGSRELDVLSTEGVLTRVNGSYISGYKFGHVAYS